MIGPTNAGAGRNYERYTIEFDATYFSSGKGLYYADGFAGFTKLDNHLSTSTANSNMSGGSWMSLEDNPYLRDCYYSITYGDGTEIRLNPYDLSKGLDGTDYSTEITQENVMFNIPTRYIDRNANGISHSRNPANGIALAHTIDGHTYKYLGIGVYPSVNVSSVAKSVSGVKPSGNITRANFRSYSSANGSPSNGKWLQWNFHHYQLMRDLVLMSTLNWDSQTYIGKGNASGLSNTYWALNGLYNDKGLFVGLRNPDYAVKSLIENMWGECWQFVDDVYVGDEYADNGGIWKDVRAGQSSSPTDDNGGGKVTVGRIYIGASSGNISSGYKFAGAIETTNAGWGLPSAYGGSTSSYTFDGYNILAVTVSSGTPTVTDAHNFLVGGNSYNSSEAGVSALYLSVSSTTSGWSFGSRLAFVHD